jgi:putative salt-induced outer membrane protein
MNRRLPLAVFLLSLAPVAQAQVPAPPVLYSPRPTAGDPSLDLFDSTWKFAAGLGFTSSTGNSRTTAVNLNVDASRITDNSKLDLSVRGLYAKFNSKVTGSNWVFGSQYDRDISPLWFGFGKFEYMADRPANISSRTSSYLGFGRHMVRSDKHNWDLATGVGYAQDRFVRPAQITGELRSNYGRAEGVLSESSNHKITQTASLKQKLGVFPNLQKSGAFRAVFDAGMSVSISASISLTMGLTYRHDSDPGEGLKRGDSLLVSGLAVKFD